MVVNEARVPEIIEFEILANTGKISVITSKKYVYRYPDSTEMQREVRWDVMNSLSYCGSLTDKYMRRYECLCMGIYALPVHGLQPNIDGIVLKNKVLR